MLGARADAPIDILVVEDTPDDADLMVEALREGRLNVRVDVVEDGEKAMAYLRRVGEYADRSSPDLILLDLHLPRMNGYEVLAEIKQDEVLRRIPVVIMTSSSKEQAILDAYDLHANCCVSKPADLDEYARAVAQIERFWLHVARRTS
jgi:CheY-like chemotaxis protein